ncbi:MAG TPA: acyl-CoA dehydrogenase family protein [Actinomycetota bacterium]|nr:acyl-CoA dehydrogenase family protein [Actinomycetota bacterium]
MAEQQRWNIFTDEHEALRVSVRDFIAREIHPHVEQWERDEDFPRALYKRFGELGLLGLKYEEEYGGSGPDLLADAVVNEELALCGSAGVAAGIGGHKDLGSYYVYRFGNDEQRRRWLVPSVAGDIIGALAVTEPNAGSDVAGLQTRATRDGEHYVLNGQKAFITNGSKADYVVVAVRTGGDGYGGISLIVVERETPGFSTRRMDTVGWRTSHTGELFFDDCRVPAENLLGEENKGFVYIMQNFQWERIIMALGAVAASQKILDMAIAYAKERHAFGRPVSKFQVWRHRFADLETEIAAARALTYHALRKFAAGEDALREVSMAKWLACELDWKVADEALQVHGGYGYMMEFPVQRAWRDARLGPIGGGTTEIMKEIIAKQIGL